MIRNAGRLGADCGSYPAASNYGTSYVDANGATIRQPLTPEQNALYLAAASVYNACVQTAAGAPQQQCPAGSSFQGGLANGVWSGQCVSTYTGQPTTATIDSPAVNPALPPYSPYVNAPAYLPPPPAAVVTAPSYLPNMPAAAPTAKTVPAAGSGGTPMLYAPIGTPDGPAIGDGPAPASSPGSVPVWPWLAAGAGLFFLLRGR